MVRYCGYEIGLDITKKQTDRLFALVHDTFSKEEIIMLSQDDLNQFARQKKDEWYHG